eukprot:TRINITY_DN14328_c0_g1_i1.p1 TRINITY_DN14328_c0_g1~~TRINITY_DN14328_c0_g1_i1.p1  ORF type:complete len:185 (+),score=40.06 TRINITY_DN14328_c0_g1_i1:31-585(+)
MTQIFSNGDLNVFVGGYEPNYSNRNWMLRNKIDFAVNCLGYDVPNNIGVTTIVFKAFELQNYGFESFQKKFSDLSRQIPNDSVSNVLFFCSLGQVRSASSAIGYLGFNLFDSALSIVSNAHIQRPIIDPYAEVVKFIIEYQITIGKNPELNIAQYLKYCDSLEGYTNEFYENLVDCVSSNPLLK